MSEKDFWEGYVPEPDKRQQALDKMAENARELGLDYEPAQCAPAADGVCESLNCPNHKPAQRTWVGLTDEEVRKVNQEVWGYVSADHARMRGYAQAIEAKLKEKNT